MGKGSKDYRRDQITPAAHMSWSHAVSYMLQSPQNIIVSTGRRNDRSYFKIDDGCLWYMCELWARAPHIFGDPPHWAQAGVRDLSETKRFDAVAKVGVAFPSCDLEQPEYEMPSVSHDLSGALEVLAARIEKLEGK